MNPEVVFKVANLVAVAGWLVLALFPRRRWAAPLAAGVAIPLVLAALYTVLIASRIGVAKGGFDTLANVALLFEDRWALLAGWVHYLAFDLFIGAWEARDAQRTGLPHLALLPCLLLTFLFGPIGLLTYFLLRTWRTRKLAVD
jgi:hypothetical protein